MWNGSTQFCGNLASCRICLIPLPAQYLLMLCKSFFCSFSVFSTFCSFLLIFFCHCLIYLKHFYVYTFYAFMFLCFYVMLKIASSNFAHKKNLKNLKNFPEITSVGEIFAIFCSDFRIHFPHWAEKKNAFVCDFLHEYFIG